MAVRNRHRNSRADLRALARRESRRLARIEITAGVTWMCLVRNDGIRFEFYESQFQRAASLRGRMSVGVARALGCRV